MPRISVMYCSILRTKQGHARFALLVLPLLAWCTLCAPSQQQPEHIQRWFDNLDSDRDGQLQQQELRHFVGANLGPTDYNTQIKLDAAVEQITDKLDGSDSGLDISVTELDQYLHRILKGVKVSDWVSHSLGLPQYAQTFKDNAITVLDFPMLVNDGGALLETELQVTRVLHRHRIMKAMQRQMLGLGSEPGTIQYLTCRPHSSSAASNSSSSSLAAAAWAVDNPQDLSHLDGISRSAAVGQDSSVDPAAASVDSVAAAAAGPVAAAQNCVVTCSWEAPGDVGDPALHKYVLERYALLSPGARWETPAEVDDNVFTQFTDVVSQPGLYQYRLAAWNLYGRSTYVLSSEVNVQACASQVRQGRQQQQQQAMLLDGAGPGGISAGSISEGIEAHLAAEHVCAVCGNTVVAGKDVQHPYTGSAVISGQPYCLQQHSDEQLCQPQQQQAQQHRSYPQHQHSNEGGNCDSPTLNCSGDSCKTALAVPGRCGPSPAAAAAAVEAETPAPSMRHNAAVTAAATAGQGGAGPPNVVWVVGANALSSHVIPSSAAAAVRQAQLLAGMQAAAGGGDADSSGRPQATRSATERSGSFRLATIVGSQLWTWLRAGLNSLVLLVLPLLVRLLPVPILHQLAAAAVKVVKMLPLRVQQMLLHAPQRSDLRSLQMNHATEQVGAPPAGARTGMVPLPGPAAEIVPETCVRCSHAGAAVGNSTTTTSSGSSSGGMRLQLSVGPPPASAAAATAAANAAFGKEVAAMPQVPAYRTHGILSAPVVPALHPAAFGCTGALPIDAAALGLHSSVQHLPESFSVGSLQVLHSDLSSCGLGGIGSASSDHLKNASSSVQRNASSGDLRAARSVTFAEPRAFPIGFGDDRCIAAPPPSPAAAVCTIAQTAGLLDSTAAAAGSAGYSQASVEAGGLQLAAALEQQGPNRKRCAYPGCQQHFDLRHFRALRQRHYCGRCQQAFCLQHTAYSPHGPSGSCGAESRCVCIDCFFEFTPEYRLFLTLRNTLVSRRAISGPPGGGDSSSSSVHDGEIGNRRTGWSAVGRLGKVGARSAKSAIAAVATPPSAWGTADGDVAAVEAATTAARNGEAWPRVSGQTAAVGSAVEGPMGAETVDSRADINSSSSKQGGTVLGKMLWARGLGKAKAVVRFKQAGRQHQH